MPPPPLDDFPEDETFPQAIHLINQEDRQHWYRVFNRNVDSRYDDSMDKYHLNADGFHHPALYGFKEELTEDDFLNPEIFHNQKLSDEELERELDSIKSLSTAHQTSYRITNIKTRDYIPPTILGRAEERLRKISAGAPLSEQYGAWLNFQAGFNDLDKIMVRLQDADAVPMWVADKMMNQIRGLSMDMAGAVADAETMQRTALHLQACQFASMDRDTFIPARQKLIKDTEALKARFDLRLEVLTLDKKYRQVRLPVLNDVHKEFILGHDTKESAEKAYNAFIQRHSCTRQCKMEANIIWDDPSMMPDGLSALNRRRWILQEGKTDYMIPDHLTDEQKSEVRLHALHRVVMNNFSLETYMSHIGTLDRELARVRQRNEALIEALKNMKAAEQRDQQVAKDLAAFKRANGRWMAEARYGKGYFVEHPEHVPGAPVCNRDSGGSIQQPMAIPTMAAPPGWVSPETHHDVEAGYMSLLNLRQRAYSQRMRGQEKFVRKEEKLFSKLYETMRTIMVKGASKALAEEVESLNSSFSVLSKQRRLWVKKPLNNPVSEKVAQNGVYDMTVSTQGNTGDSGSVMEIPEYIAGTNDSMALLSPLHSGGFFGALDTHENTGESLLPALEFPSAKAGPDIKRILGPDELKQARQEKINKRRYWFAKLRHLPESTEVAAPAYVWRSLVRAIMKKSALVEGLRLHTLTLQRKLKKEINLRSAPQGIDIAVGKVVRDLNSKFAMQLEKTNYEHKMRELDLKHLIRQYESVAQKVSRIAGKTVIPSIDDLLQRSAEIRQSIEREHAERVEKLEATVQLLEEEVIGLKRVRDEKSGNLPSLSTSELAARSSAAMKLRNENMRLKYEIEELRELKVTLPKGFRKVDVASGGVDTEELEKMRSRYEIEMEAKDNAITTLMDYTSFIENLDVRLQAEKLNEAILNVAEREKELLHLQKEASERVLKADMKILDAQDSRTAISRLIGVVHDTTKTLQEGAIGFRTRFMDTLLPSNPPQTQSLSGGGNSIPVEGYKKVRSSVTALLEFLDVTLNQFHQDFEQAAKEALPFDVGAPTQWTRAELYGQVAKAGDHVNYLKHLLAHYEDVIRETENLVLEAPNETIANTRYHAVLSKLRKEKPFSLACNNYTMAELTNGLIEADSMRRTNARIMTQAELLVRSAHEARFELVALLDNANTKRIEERKAKEKALFDIVKIRKEYGHKIQMLQNMLDHMRKTRASADSVISKKMEDKIAALRLEVSEAKTCERMTRLALDKELVKNTALELEVKSKSGGSLGSPALTHALEQLDDLKAKYDEEIYNLGVKAATETKVLESLENDIAFETDLRNAAENELEEIRAGLERERDSLYERVTKLEQKIAEMVDNGADDELNAIHLQMELQSASEKLAQQDLDSKSNAVMIKVLREQVREYRGNLAYQDQKAQVYANETMEYIKTIDTNLKQLVDRIGGGQNVQADDLMSVLRMAADQLSSRIKAETEVGQKNRIDMLEKEMLQARSSLDKLTIVVEDEGPYEVVLSRLQEQQRESDTLRQQLVHVTLQLEKLKKEMTKAQNVVQELDPEQAVSQVNFVNTAELRSAVLGLLNQQARRHTHNIQMMASQIETLQGRVGAYKALSDARETSKVSFTTMTQLMNAFAARQNKEIDDPAKAQSITLADIQAFWEVAEIYTLRGRISSLCVANQFDNALNAIMIAQDRLTEMTIGQKRGLWSEELRGSLFVLKAWAAALKGDAHQARTSLQTAKTMMPIRWEGRVFVQLIAKVESELAILQQLEVEAGQNPHDKHLIARCRCRVFKCPLHAFRECACQTTLKVTPCRKHIAILEPRAQDSRMRGLNERLQSSTRAISAQKALLGALGNNGPRKMKPSVQTSQAVLPALPHWIMPVEKQWPLQAVTGTAMDSTGGAGAGAGAGAVGSLEMGNQEDERGRRRPAPIETERRSPGEWAREESQSGGDTDDSEMGKLYDPEEVEGYSEEGEEEEEEDGVDSRPLSWVGDMEHVGRSLDAELGDEEFGGGSSGVSEESGNFWRQ